MARKNYKPEEIVSKLRQADVLLGQGTKVPDVVRSIGVTLDFSRPGKPTDNAFIEAFNSRLRQDCLNASWFLSPADARSRIEAWRIDDNQTRPHTSLGGLTPDAFAALLQPARKTRMTAGPKMG